MLSEVFMCFQKLRVSHPLRALREFGWGLRSDWVVLKTFIEVVSMDLLASLWLFQLSNSHCEDDNKTTKQGWRMKMKDQVEKYKYWKRPKFGLFQHFQSWWGKFYDAHAQTSEQASPAKKLFTIHSFSRHQHQAPTISTRSLNLISNRWRWFCF